MEENNNNSNNKLKKKAQPSKTSLRRILGSVFISTDVAMMEIMGIWVFSILELQKKTNCLVPNNPMV